MTAILNTLKGLKGGVKLPQYAPQEHGTGIVHLGLGAFHKAHQAAYTDDALAEDGGDWRIAGVSMRSTRIPEILNEQSGLYTLLVNSSGGTAARVISSISRAVSKTREPDKLTSLLAEPATRIVSLTVTEKAYGIDRASGGVCLDDPVIQHDLQNPDIPQGVLGTLAAASQLRLTKTGQPFTVLCCDNLPDNGNFIRSGLLDFADRVDPALARWINENVTFPSSMVDRITPAQTDRTLELALTKTGRHDRAAVETEPFHQWVIEDSFANGRPLWEAGGAVFTDDVAPFERMKLRMLNGTHSMLAYAGYLAGHQYVRDCMVDQNMVTLIERHMSAASSTLEPIRGSSFADYQGQLLERFANPEIAHETFQICMDGSEKLPQRIFAPALDACTKGTSVRPFAFATAMWMRFCLGKKDDGTTYSLQDPASGSISTALARTNSANEIVEWFSEQMKIVPPDLYNNSDWTTQVNDVLSHCLAHGVVSVIKREARMVDAG